MITPTQLEQRLEPFESPQFDFVMPTTSQLNGYRLSNLDRDSGALHMAFRRLDRKGPKRTLIELCGRQDTVTVLDAGCGTGGQLAWLIGGVATMDGIEPERILADGVSDHDFSTFSRDRFARVAIGAGLINYMVMDLASEELPPDSYDLAYSHEVLMHNDRPERIIDNVFGSLKPGRAMYFNTDGRQVEQVDVHMEKYRRAGAEVLSGEIISPPYAYVSPGQGNETRHAFKLTKPLA